MNPSDPHTRRRTLAVSVDTRMGGVIAMSWALGLSLAASAAFSQNSRPHPPRTLMV